MEGIDAEVADVLADDFSILHGKPFVEDIGSHLCLVVSARPGIGQVGNGTVPFQITDAEF